MKSGEWQKKDYIAVMLGVIGRFVFVLFVPVVLYGQDSTSVRGDKRNSVNIPLEFDACGHRAGWNLIFTDDFGGPGLDRLKWDVQGSPNYFWGGCPKDGHNNVAVSDRNTVSVENGICALKTINQEDPNAWRDPADHSKGKCPCSFGAISTLGYNQSFKPYEFLPNTRYEIRAKLPYEMNIGSAAWLFAAGKYCDDGYQEIDIWETSGPQMKVADVVEVEYRNRFHTNYWWWSGRKAKVQPLPPPDSPDFQEKFCERGRTDEYSWVRLNNDGRNVFLHEHFITYQLMWLDERISWGANGFELTTIDFSEKPQHNKYVDELRIDQADRPMHLILNAGENYVGDQSEPVDPALLPQNLELDQVCVYQREGTHAVDFINPAFSEDKGTHPFEICSYAVHQGTQFAVKARYYPYVTYEWASPAFDISVGTRPEEVIATLRDGVAAGKHSVKVKSTFPTGYVEVSTLYVTVSDTPQTPTDIVISESPGTCTYTAAVIAKTGEHYLWNEGTGWSEGNGYFDKTMNTYLNRFGAYTKKASASIRVVAKNECGISDEYFEQVTFPSENVKGCFNLPETIEGVNIISCEVYSSEGRLLKSTRQKNEISILLKELPAGIYYLRYVLDSGRIIHVKYLKIR